LNYTRAWSILVIYYITSKPLINKKAVS